MDSTKLVPNGDFSFSVPGRSADYKRYLERVTRRSVAPLKYYFIDFETAIQYSPDEPHPRCHSPVRQQEWNVPELMGSNLDYDPFKLDVYQIGSVFIELSKVSIHCVHTI